MQFNSCHKASKLEISITDILGKVIFRSNNKSDIGENLEIIPTEKLANGVYNLNIQNEDMQIVQSKFVKQ